jgi:hypothetical protein
MQKLADFVIKNKGKIHRKFIFTFEEQLNHQHPILSHQIKWSIFEAAFKIHYSRGKGAPSI